MHSDAEKFGSVVDALVGQECERTLACNSLKLRFNTSRDPRGEHYIWLDPPWQLWQRDELVTRSLDYSEEQFEKWSELFAPLNRTKFTAWREEKDLTVVFEFSGGYSLRLPFEVDRQEDHWYDHWYARDTSTESGPHD